MSRCDYFPSGAGGGGAGTPVGYSSSVRTLRIAELSCPESLMRCRVSALARKIAAV